MARAASVGGDASRSDGSRVAAGPYRPCETDGGWAHALGAWGRSAPHPWQQASGCATDVPLGFGRRWWASGSGSGHSGVQRLSAQTERLFRTRGGQGRPAAAHGAHKHTQRRADLLVHVGAWTHAFDAFWAFGAKRIASRARGRLACNTARTPREELLVVAGRRESQETGSSCAVESSGPHPASRPQTETRYREPIYTENGVGGRL